MVENSYNYSDPVNEADYQSQAINKFLKRKYRLRRRKIRAFEWGNSLELLIAGVSTVLSLFQLTEPIGAIGSFSLLVWQEEQQKRFIQDITRQLKNLDLTKLDWNSLNSDEFIALVIQAVEAASKSKSEFKRRSLAQALVNSVIRPTSELSGKDALLRILIQMSDEEMLILKIIHNNNNLEENLLGVHENEIAKCINWDEQEVGITCESLLQIGLVYQPRVGLTFGGYENLRIWSTTRLADKLIRWCAEE